LPEALQFYFVKLGMEQTLFTAKIITYMPYAVSDAALKAILFDKISTLGRK
jgi:hypothetical protein